MQRFYRISRYFLPVMFFGYVPFANLAVYEQPGGKLAAFDMAALRGTVTHSFDTLYKTAMPHREWQHAMSGTRRLRELQARIRALENSTNRAGADQNYNDSDGEEIR